MNNFITKDNGKGENSNFIDAYIKMERIKKIKLTQTQSLVLGIIGIIFVGAILLMLPISNNEGKSIKFLDSLFMVTTSVCVTGLTTVVPSEQFSLFGKTVIMFLIEVGGIRFYELYCHCSNDYGKKIKFIRPYDH